MNVVDSGTFSVYDGDGRLQSSFVTDEYDLRFVPARELLLGYHWVTVGLDWA